MNTPRHVVAAAFEALRRNDWKGLALLCDPLSLDAFKIEMLEEFGDHFGEPDPDIPTSTMEPIELDDEMYAEYMKYLHPDSMMKVEFPKLSTMDDLRHMEAVDAFACWMEGQASPGAAAADSSDEPWKNGAPKTDSSDRRSDWPRYAIIGCVFDSPDIAHVVYRPEASPLEHYGDAWESWLSRAPAKYRDFMIAMHHRGIPMLITCRRQGDASWRLVANRRFSFFGSLQVVEFRRDS